MIPVKEVKFDQNGGNWARSSNNPLVEFGKVWFGNKFSSIQLFKILATTVLFRTIDVSLHIQTVQIFLLRLIYNSINGRIIKNNYNTGQNWNEVLLWINLMVLYVIYSQDHILLVRRHQSTFDVALHIGRLINDITWLEFIQIRHSSTTVDSLVLILVHDPNHAFVAWLHQH